MTSGARGSRARGSARDRLPSFTTARAADLTGTALCVLISPNDVALASAVRGSILMLGGLPADRFAAADLARRDASDLQALAPGGLFARPAVIVIDSVQETHARHLPLWRDALYVESGPPLILSVGAQKPPQKLRNALSELSATLFEPAMATPKDAIRALCRLEKFASLSEAERKALESAASGLPLFDIERRLELHLLSNAPDDPDRAEALKQALQEAHLALDQDLTRALFAGDGEKALAVFRSDIRSPSDLSGLLNRLPYSLNRAPANVRDNALRGVLLCERALRSQSPFAFLLAERLMLRLARALR